MKRVHVFVSGRVQGVCFRVSTREKAQEFKIKGWVRNVSDGRVEALFEGESSQIDKMIMWCHRGPHRSKVLAVITQDQVYEGSFDDFCIIR